MARGDGSTHLARKQNILQYGSLINLRGVFTTRLPKSQDPDAVETIEISSDCYIEIFCRSNVYTYCMMELDFDDDYCVYYWAPAAKVLPTGMYDTKERAILAAKETLTCRERLQ